MTSIFEKPTIGDLILAYRKRNHLRREILAKQLDVKPETIRNWETGDTKPALKSLVRLADVMGLSLREVYAISRSQ